jgi:hypothetical protein
MTLKVIFAVIGVAAGIGALIVDDHVTQAGLGITAVVLLLAVYSFSGKKISGYKELIRLLLWP